MKNKTLKTTSILLILLLFIMVNSIIFSNPILTPKAEAAGINDSDIVTGLGIAFILYLLFEAVDNDKLVEPEIDTSDFEEKRDYDITINSINVDLLAKAIYAEARGESLEGQIAVGAVIINRMNSPEFPNTVRSVLYQPNQFKCTENGQINQTPNETAYTAAERAVSGEDPSNGALFFYNPEKSVDPSAFDRYQVTAIIGDHIFAK